MTSYLPASLGACLPPVHTPFPATQRSLATAHHMPAFLAAQGSHPCSYRGSESLWKYKYPPHVNPPADVPNVARTPNLSELLASPTIGRFLVDF